MKVIEELAWLGLVVIILVVANLALQYYDSKQEENHPPLTIHEPKPK